MKKSSYTILPATEQIVKTMGEQIKLARLRRNLSVELVAERAGISRASLWNVEKGSPSVAIGIYAAVWIRICCWSRKTMCWAEECRI